MKTIPCKSCSGTGRVAAPTPLRTLRLESGISLREASRRIGLSAPYISDLERGRRAWNADLEARYRKALKR